MMNIPSSEILTKLPYGFGATDECISPANDRDVARNAVREAVELPIQIFWLPRHQ